MRRDLTLMYVAQALRYVAPLILLPFYGRTLGVAAYGQLLSAMALMQLVWVVVEWGLPAAGVRNAANANTGQARARLVGEQICARLLITALAAPFCIAAAMLVPALHANVTVSLLCALLGIVSAFNMTWYFQGRLQFRTAAVVELCGLCISTGLILLSVRTPADAWLIPGSLLAVATLSFVVQLRLCSRTSTGSFALVAGSAISSIRSSTMLFLDRGQTLLLGPLCILLLAALIPAPQVAAFAIAERLMGVLAALLAPLNQVFMGLLSQSVAQARQGALTAQTHRLMRKVFSSLVALYVVIGVVAFGASGRLVSMVFGQGFEGVIPIFQVLTAAFVVLGTAAALVSVVLYPLGHDRDVAIVSSIRMVSTIGLATLAGALLGGVGAAWGRLFGGCAALSIVMVCLRRRSLLSVVFHNA